MGHINRYTQILTSIRYLREGCKSSDHLRGGCDIEIGAERYLPWYPLQKPLDGDTVDRMQKLDD